LRRQAGARSGTVDAPVDVASGAVARLDAHHMIAKDDVARVVS